MPPGRVLGHIGNIAAVQYLLKALQDASFLMDWR